MKNCVGRILAKTGRYLIPGILATAGVAAGQATSTLWSAATQPQFDGGKTANVNQLAVTRDSLHLTFTDGTIQFAAPVNGRTFAAVFEGHGHIQVAAPNPQEAQQLRLFLKEGELSLDFTQAVLSFTDGTYDEVAKQLSWNQAPAGGSASLYEQRQKEREDEGIPITPRLAEGLASEDRAGSLFFNVDMKTSAGWVQASFDAEDPEEITVGRWVASAYQKGFDTWMNFPAGGRTSAEAFRNPQENDPYITDSYEVDANLTANADLTATTKVALHFPRAGTRAMVFALDGNLRVDSVKNSQGTALPYWQAKEENDRYPHYGDYVLVMLPQAAQAGGKEALEFHYAGKRVIKALGNDNYFCQSYGWYPAGPEPFAQRSGFALTFHTPKKLTVVATGKKTGETVQGNERVSTWKSEVPLAVAGFAYGDYKETDQMAGPVHLQIFASRNPDQYMTALNEYFHPDITGAGDPRQGSGLEQMAPTGDFNPSTATKMMAAEFSNNLKLFQDYFGPYPYSTLSVTNIPFSYGQGWPGLLYISVLSFLDPTQRHVIGVKDDIQLTDFFRAHETSHQWWGHRVGWKSYHDQWMSEGFAQFSGNLYVQYRENPGEYLKRIRIDRDALLAKDGFGHTYDSVGPVWMGERLASSVSPGGYDTVIYDKGGLVLNTLRMMMLDSTNKDPDHNFKDLMRDFCQTYENKPASTEDFKAIVEKHMGQWMDIDHNHRMDWFFNEYVYGTGVPHYGLKYEARDMDGKFTVVGTLTQSGVPDGWKDIVPIYVHVPGKGDVRAGWLTVTSKETPLKFTLPVKVDKISINNNEDMLMVVEKIM